MTFKTQTMAYHKRRLKTDISTATFLVVTRGSPTPSTCGLLHSELMALPAKCGPQMFI